MYKLEHIGIAVKSLSQSIPLFEALLNTSCYKEELVESESVTTAFFALDNHKIELLESTDHWTTTSLTESLNEAL